MKKILSLLMILSFFALPCYSGKISGDKLPCPGKVYTCTYSGGEKGSTVHLRIQGGKFSSDGSTSKYFHLQFGATSFTFDVVWDDVPNGSIFENSSDKNLINIRSLKNRVNLDEYPIATGTHKDGFEISKVENGPVGNGDFSLKGTLYIRYGEEGEVKIKVPSIPYPTKAGDKVTYANKFRWKINGKEDTKTRGNTYTLKHSKTDYDNSTIVVTVMNDCNTNLSDSKPTEIKIVRSGRQPTVPENVNIQNENIVSAKVIEATNRITVTNVTVSNNALVDLVAGTELILYPESVFKEGTDVTFRIKNQSGLLKSEEKGIVEEDYVEEEIIYDQEYIPVIRSMKVAGSDSQDDFASIDQIGDLKIVQLFPNPTDGILNFECSDAEAECSVKVYSISGGIVYSNDAQRNGDLIDLGALTKGMYLAKITIGGETITQKIILK